MPQIDEKKYFWFFFCFWGTKSGRKCIIHCFLLLFSFKFQTRLIIEKTTKCKKKERKNNYHIIVQFTRILNSKFNHPNDQLVNQMKVMQ